MSHKNILFFLNNNKLSFYTYEKNDFTPCYYKGDRVVHISPENTTFWETFWKYIEKQFVKSPWESMQLSALYHNTNAHICQELYSYPLQCGLKNLRIETLEMALPQLLCKMDILKQELCPVRFEDSAWNVSPYNASPVPIEANMSPYKLREDEIVKAYLGAFPVQGSGNIQPANNVSSESKALHTFIEGSKVKVKPSTPGGRHE